LSAELRHCSSIGIGYDEGRTHRPCALGKELDRLVLRHDRERGAIPWQGQWIDREDLLGMEMEQGPAGGQHLERGTTGQKGAEMSRGP
jgi:hypothetical protein